MNTVLILVSIILFTGQTLSMKLIQSNLFRERLLIYSGFTLIAAIGLLLFSLFQPEVREIHPITLMFGILFGLGFMLTIIFYNLAISTGPLSYTAFYFAASMLIPTFIGFIAFNELLTIAAIIAVFLFLGAFYFINVNPNSKKENTKKGDRWLLYCLLTFLFNGLLGVIQKFHQYQLEGTQATGLMLVGFCSAFVFYWIAYSIQYVRDKKSAQLTLLQESTTLWHNILPMVLLASTSLIGNIIMTFLSGVVPSFYLYPLVQGSVIVSITLCSMLLFREKLTTYGKLGITLGVIAIVVINF
ncbi:hypothetical protein ACK8P5_19535 [Paenibacillus sp. EC2-1]|uniref:hypothetical protein n=1 Tax=Paenibacillus sp. EC2-1 TaxID=3388665 RepID=UPI003BEEF167